MFLRVVALRYQHRDGTTPTNIVKDFDDRGQKNYII